MTQRPSHVFAALLTALFLVGAPVPSRALETRAFIAATDYLTGSLASISFGPPRVAAPNVASVSPDPLVRWYDGLVYVVNRFNYDNIQVLDPANNFSVVRQFSVGNGANPHDIEFASATKAYVTRYESADLLVVNPSTGAVLDSISLAGFADADGIPEMDHLALRSGRLFVTLQRLDRNNFFSPAGGSAVVVIDATADTIIDVDPGTPGVQGILLPVQDPFTKLVVDPARQLIVGCAGSWGVPDGAIVRIDPVTYAVSTEITESALGGDVNSIAAFSATDGFAVVSDASFNTILKSYRRDLGTAQTMLASSGYYLADIAVNDRGELWVCDRNYAQPGIRVFDAASHAELTASPLSTGLPPFDLAFDSAPSLVAVDGPPGPPAGTLSLLGAAPNPSRGIVRFSLALGAGAGSPGGDVGVEIVDVGGRVWWTASLAAPAAGEHTVTWDGRTTGGREAPAGIYFVRVRAGEQTASQRFVRVR